MTEPKERLLDLLAERATSGLGAAEKLELQNLLAAHPEWANDSFDLAAAALDQALSGPPEPLPAHLRQRLLQSAESFVATRSSSAEAGDPAARPDSLTSSAADSPGGATVVRMKPRTGSSSRAGWLAAAAALVTVVAAYMWLSGGFTDRTPSAAAEARRQLVATAGDLLEVPWTATEDLAARGAEGDVVWSAAAQAGFMTIRGLAANDAGEYQYQLWVFDAGRDERYPVDGGVFDVAEGAAEVVVPIDVRVPVSEALLFAVTVEPPGGVVVSTRERVVLLAQPGSAGN